MLPGRDAPRQQPSARRTRAAFAGIAAAVILGPAHAQDLPDPQASLQAHQTVRAWVRAWSVPDRAGFEGGPPVHGAAVTLRLDGQILSRGAWFTSDQPDPLAIWHAAGEAVRLGRAALPIENDALAEDRAAELGERTTISLELFGPPIAIPPDELALPYAGCSPGAEALVVRAGDAVRVTGADAQVTRGSDPARAFASMAADITAQGDTSLRPLPELAENGFTFSRASVVHLAMPFEGASPVFLDRAGRIVPSQTMRTPEMRAMADSIAAHLRSRVWPGVEHFGIGGPLNAATGRPDPVVAAPFEQAMSAIALFRHAGIAAGTEAGLQSGEVALRIARDLGTVEPGEDAPWSDPIAASATVGALAEMTPAQRASDPVFEVLRVRCLNEVRSAFDPDAGFTASVPPAAYGLIAWAHVQAIGMGEGFTTERADAAVRTAFRETPAGNVVSQMPFLAWADMGLHTDAELPSAVALRAMRDLCWEHQLHWRDLRPIDRDLAGGIVFTRSRVALPTWQSLRPMAALASMLGDSRVTPGSFTSPEIAREVVRVTDALRFVRQLQMDGECLYLARSPSQVSGGLRRATWDPTVSPEASAMGLLTVTEALRSMQGIVRREQQRRESVQSQP